MCLGNDVLQLYFRFQWNSLQKFIYLISTWLLLQIEFKDIDFEIGNSILLVSLLKDRETIFFNSNNLFFNKLFLKNNNKLLFYLTNWISLVQFSHSMLSDSLRPLGLQTPGIPVHHQIPELTQTHVHWVVMPSNHLILCRPLLLPPAIFPSIKVSSNESVLHIRWPKDWSFSFSMSFQWIFRTDFLWLVESPCCPRDSQESSPTPQFKSINFLVLSFLYSSTLTSIHDY